jgi:hypothetical protein
MIALTIARKALSMMSIRRIFPLFIYEPAIFIAKNIAIITSLAALKIGRIRLVSLTFCYWIKFFPWLVVKNA